MISSVSLEVKNVRSTGTDSLPVSRGYMFFISIKNEMPQKQTKEENDEKE